MVIIRSSEALEVIVILYCVLPRPPENKFVNLGTSRSLLMGLFNNGACAVKEEVSDKSFVHERCCTLRLRASTTLASIWYRYNVTYPSSGFGAHRVARYIYVPHSFLCRLSKSSCARWLAFANNRDQWPHCLSFFFYCCVAPLYQPLRQLCAPLAVALSFGICKGGGV